MRALIALCAGLVLITGCARPTEEKSAQEIQKWSYLVVDVDASPEWKKTAGVYLLYEGKKLPLPAVFRARHEVNWERPYGDWFTFTINGHAVELAAERRDYLDKLRDMEISSHIAVGSNDLTLSTGMEFSFKLKDSSFAQKPTIGIAPAVKAVPSTDEREQDKAFPPPDVITLPEANGDDASRPKRRRQ